MLSSLVGAPAAYLRQLPAPLAGIILQYGLTNYRAEQIKTMDVANGHTELRAVTGPDYGRIYDFELVSAVQRIAGNGTGDTRWKVPGVIVELSADIHRDLCDYAAVLGHQTGQVLEPARLVAPMLDRFMSTDRGFATVLQDGIASQPQDTRPIEATGH